MSRTFVGALMFCLGGLVMQQAGNAPPAAKQAEPALRLGKFSVSLLVQDIAKSRAFYEALGFHVTGGDAAKKWLMLQNGTTNLGLFQGMLSRNTLTFSPGMDNANKTLPDFDDVRTIQKALKSRGIAIKTEVDEKTTGMGSMELVDPDGNPVLFDQYVASPKK